MAPIQEEIISMLDGLIHLNRDRATGYNKAVGRLLPTDIDLQTVFTNMSNHSRQFVIDLTNEIVKLGGEPSAGSSSEKHIKVWMEMHHGGDRRSLIALSAFGEDAILKAYREAERQAAGYPDEIKIILGNHIANLESACGVIKRYHEMQSVH